MSNTKLNPNPFTQAIKDRKEGVLLGPVTVDNLFKLGEKLWENAHGSSQRHFSHTILCDMLIGEPTTVIDNVKDQK